MVLKQRTILVELKPVCYKTDAQYILELGIRNRSTLLWNKPVIVFSALFPNALQKIASCIPILIPQGAGGTANLTLTTFSGAHKLFKSVLMA